MNSPWREHKIKLNKNTAYRLWNGGLFNQLISLELAVGISYLINDIINIHGVIKLPSYSNSFEEKNNYITDFIEIPNRDKIYFSKYLIKTPSSHQINISNLMDRFIQVDSGDKDIDKFAEGRSLLILDQSKSYYFNNNLSYYSIMFFNRTKSFNRKLRKIVFKKEYVEFAKMISDQIGKFSGIHLRQTDFKSMIYSVKKEEYDSAIFKLKQSSNLIAVSTDELDSKIALNYGDVVYIDNIIKDNFLSDFKQLSIASKLSFDLICMLIMCNSEDFIGTIGSTYSGLIHRNINQRKNNTHHWINMGDYQNISGHPFSWNSYDKISIGKKLWWREWKESYIG
jgi:hypothetical protein